MEVGDAPRQGAGHVFRRVFGESGQQRCTRLVVAADHPWPLAVGQGIQRVLELAFDKPVLLLDHQHFLEPGGKFAQALRICGIGHVELEHADAERRGLVVVQAELEQRLAHIGPGLAGGDDAIARRLAPKRHAVEAVGAGESERGIELVRPQARLLVQPAVGNAQVHAIRRQGVVARQDDGGTRRIGVYHRRGIDRVGNQLEADPAARIARHGPAQQGVIDDLLHIRRVKHRHEHVGEQGLVCRGGIGGR